MFDMLNVFPWVTKPRWTPRSCNWPKVRVRHFADKGRANRSATRTTLFASGSNGKPRNACQVATRRSGLCLLDSADVRAKLSLIYGDTLDPTKEILNLKAVRRFLRYEMGLRNFVYVYRFSRDRRRKYLRREVRRCGWKCVEPVRSKFGFDRDDPANDYIHWRLESLIEVYGPKMPAVCLISHQGQYAECLSRFLAIRGQVGLMGCLGFFDTEIYRLTGSDPIDANERVRMFDLDADAHAIELPNWWLGAETERTSRIRT